MTILEAKKIINDYYANTNPSVEDQFVYSEALKFLIEETKDSDYMVELGAMYYEQCDFDLALKYYDMAAEYNNLYAISNLGYIWYYGRTGEKNYEKAFYYFNRARKMGDLIATYKVADMYKNGYFVERDPDQYRSMIEDLYPKVKNAYRLNEPLPETFTRLAGIRTEEGNTEEALRLYDLARDFFSQRIWMHRFFGDRDIMKWMIQDIYRLRKFPEDGFGLYDLYYLLEQPAKFRFTFEGKPHEVEAVHEDGQLVIRFDDKWFRTVDDFFGKAELDGEYLTSRYEELFDFEVL